MAMAHDHDTTKIEDGESVSADPIVSWTTTRKAMERKGKTLMS